MTDPAGDSAPAPRRRPWPLIALTGAVIVVLAIAGVGIVSAVTGGFGGAIASLKPSASGGAPAGGTSGGYADGGYGVTGGGSASGGGPTASDNPADDGDDPGADPATDPEPATWAPTVIILDASGSMVRDVPGGGTRMEAARQATVELVKGLGSDAVVGLTVFGTGTGNSPAEQAAGCTDITIKVPVGPVDQATFVAAINSIRQSGYTPLGPALRNAAAQLPSDGAATIVLVSDGVDTCAPPPSCDVARELRAAHPDLTIQAIGFNVDADEAAQEALSCIAQVGGGEYFAAGNAAQLAAKLRLASDPTASLDVITGTGFNELHLGMSYDAARAADSSVEDADVSVHIIYVDCDAGKLEFTDGVLTAILPADDTPTAEGIAPGDSIAHAEELYGQPTDQGSDDDGDYLVFASDYQGITGYRAYVEGDRIVWIVVCICGPHADRASRDYSTWQIGFGTLGPLQLGMSFDDMYSAIGDSTPHGQYSGGFEYCPARDMADSGPGAQVSVFGSFDPSNGYSPVETIDEFMINGYDLDAGMLPRTARDIGIGSSQAEVEAAYPGVSYVRSIYQYTYAIVTARNGISLVMSFDETDRVNYLQMGNWTNPPYEICL